MIVPTPRLLLVACLGVVPIVLLGSRDTALYIAILWLGLIAVLTAVDAWFAPGGSEVRWERTNDSKLSLGAWNAVTLRATNTTPRAVTLQVRDGIPRYLKPEGEASGAVCPGHSSWSFEYRLFPIHRGDYDLGPIAARYLGPLGLAWRQTSTGPLDPVKVYPNLLAVRSYEALVRRGRLEELGLRSSRRWGAGTEFERLREYTPDDEYRRISWTATARRGTPITVDYQVERSQNVMLLLDCGRLMSTRVALSDEALSGEARHPEPLTRLDYSLNAALLLTYISIEYGDRVGLLAFTDRITRYIAPAPGRRQFLTIAELLYNLRSEGTEASYDTALGYLAVRNPRRSLAVLFTDVVDSDAAGSLVMRAAHLARSHLPVVVTVRDPDVERLARSMPEDVRGVYERAVAGRVLDSRAEILRRLESSGVLTVDAPADKLSPSLINRYLEIKGRGRL